MEIGSEKCDFGVHLDEDCNNLHYVRKSGIRPFSSIESETQDLVLYRSGLKYKSIKSICFHQEAKLGFPFENRFNKCCDPFKINKKHVKGGQKISTDIAKTIFNNIDGDSGGWRGYDNPSNVFTPFGKSAIFSYHSVNLKYFLTIR